MFSMPPPMPTRAVVATSDAVVALSTRDEAEEVHTSTKGDEKSVVLQNLDQPRNAEGGDCGCEGPHLHDPACIGHRLAMDDKEVRLEVGVY